MASACVNNIGMSPENFLDFSPTKRSSYGWLSPRISFSRDFPEEETNGKASSTAEETDIIGDFEFLLEDPVNMLPADELFSDGKLVPMHLSSVRTVVTASEPATPEVRSTDMPKTLQRRNEISAMDPYLFSPKAPSCTSIRWKELLALKKLYSNGKQRHNDDNKTSSSSSSSSSPNVIKSLKFNTKQINSHETSSSTKSLKGLLNRSSKTSSSSLSLPLLKDNENDTVIQCSLSRLSLSSSSNNHEDLPRLSLDTSGNNLPRKSIPKPKSRVVKPRLSSASSTSSSSSSSSSSENSSIIGYGVSADSPRMNSSGKIVFQSLERSSSSPGSFNGGPRHVKNRAAMERSKSANVVRVTPVLNVCSVRSSSKSGGVFGFPLFSSSHPKKESHQQVNSFRNI